MPIAEDSAGGSPVPIPTNLTTNLTGEATGSGTLDYTTGDIDIAVTVVDNGHNHILSNITDVQVNNAISGQILVTMELCGLMHTNTSGITAIVQDLTPQLGGNLDLNGKNINGNGNINLADNYKLTLGTGNDLEISHDGVSSYIRDVGAGDLQIFASDDVYIRGQGSNTYMARFNESGAVTLYHNNVIRLITTDSGITVTDEVEAAEFIGPLRGPTKFKGQAGEALSAGDPVYISGISGNTTVVSKADANDASKMPAFGIIDASVSANATCQVLTFGEMHNLDTSAFSEGDELYVSNTGTLTTAIPSGESSQIQKIAKVTRSHASAGGIFIMGAGRSNAVPNLDNGDIFIGDGTNHATTTSLNTAVNALTLTNYLPLSGGAMTGNITTSGTFDGRDVSVDGAKLDGIATGADVTLNEISAGTNVTISAGGVISSTASGGLAHVVDDTTPQLGGNLDLNSNDITGTGNLNFTGSVTLSGTVDGRDVAADGTKLDGIEAGATTDQTAAQIKTAYESNSNTNAFTDADQTKLNNIEASADVTDTANVTAAGALMDSEVTNLAQVKAFDSSDYATAAQGTTADAALPKAGGTMTGDILFNDGVKAKFGASNDLQIWHNGTDSYVYDTGEGDLILRGSSNIKLQSSSGTALSTFTAAGASTLYFSAAEKLATTSSGIDVTGNIDLPDNGKLLLGASDDLQLYHDSSNSYIKEGGTGNLFIDATSLRLRTGAGTETYLTADGNGSVDLYYDNVKKLETTSTGIDVTGDIDLTGRLGIGTSSPAHELHIESTSPTIRMVDTDGSNTLEITQSGSASYLTFDNNMRFRNASAVEKLRIDSDGIDVTGVTKTSGSGYNPANTGWATNASLITSGSYGGGLTFLDGSAGYSIRVENSGADLVIGQGATSGALTEKVKIDANGLDVTGELRTTGSIYLNSGTADSPQVVWSSSGYSDQYIDNFQGNLRVVNSGAQQVTIKQGGNVGIGLSAPTAKMHLFTDGIDQSMFSAQADLGTNNRILTLKSPVSDSASEPYRWQTSNSIQWEIDGTETKSMLLNSAGNLGVGTYSPSVKLDCAGSAKFNDSVEIQADSGFAFMEMGGPSGAFIDLKSPFSDDYDLRLQQDGSQSKLRTLGTSVQIDTSSGYVHIGPQNTSYCHFTTDRTRYYFNQNLVVAGNRVVSSYGGDLLLQRGQSSTQQISLGLSQVVMTGQLNIAGANPSSNNGAFEVPVISSSTPAIVSVSAGTTSLRTHHSFENSNGQVGKINTLGTQTIYSTSSDYRLKTDVQPMQGSIDRVKALKPCNFEWITDGTRVDGFIAHEAQEVVPESVIGEKDGMRDKVNIITPLVEATYDQEGNELTAEIPAVTETEQVPDYQGIDQSKIVPLLTSALQDAIAKIEALETRLEALES